MPLVDEVRAERLITLTRERFDADLSEIEVEVLRHSCRYEDPPDWVASPLDLAPNIPPLEHDPTIDSTGRPGLEWQGPKLRPALLRWLLTDPEAIALLEHRGLRVWRARITDPLDLRGCRIPARIEFRYCVFTEPINLISAEIVSFYIRDSTLQHGIVGSRVRLHGPLFIENVVAHGELNFNSATVDGEVYIGDTTLRETGTALTLQGTIIANHLRLGPNFESAGRLFLEGLRVSEYITVGDILCCWHIDRKHHYSVSE
jgi:hypothetical protein